MDESKFHFLFAGKVSRIDSSRERTLVTIEDQKTSLTIPVDMALSGETYEALDKVMSDGDYVSLGINVEEF